MERNNHDKPQEIFSLVEINSARVMLALIRIYLNIRIDARATHSEEIGAYLWSHVCRHLPLLLQALSSEGAGDLNNDEFLAGYTDKDGIPEKLRNLVSNSMQTGDIPNILDTSSRLFLSAMLRYRAPRFIPLFEAVEADLKGIASRISDTDAAINLLSSMLNLTRAEKCILHFSAAIFISGEVDRLPHIKQPLRKIQAIHAACPEVTEDEIYRAYSASSTLSRSGLLTCTDLSHDLDDLLNISRSTRHLIRPSLETAQSMAEVVLKKFPVRSDTSHFHWPHLNEEMRMLKALLKGALDRKTCGVNVLIYGPPGTGKTAYVGNLLNELGIHGFLVDSEDKDQQPATAKERLTSLGLSQIFAPKDGVQNPGQARMA